MTQRIFFTAVFSLAILFSNAISLHAESDSIYKMTVGKKFKHIFRGGAEKIIVEVIDGGKAYVEVRFAHEK